jgi:hypothetical protein
MNNIKKTGVIRSLPLGFFSILFFMVVVHLLYLLTTIDKIESFHIITISGYLFLSIVSAIMAINEYKYTSRERGCNERKCRER